MTTVVTGLTAERMIQMENATIINANLTAGGHLILITKDGHNIDVGLVKGANGTNGAPGAPGAPGATGPAGPAGAPAIPKYSNLAALTAANPAPAFGDNAFLQDIGSPVFWLPDSFVGTGNKGWYPPWNTAWGNVKNAYKQLATNSTPINGPGNIAGLEFTIKVPVNRKVIFKIEGAISLDAGSSAEARLHVNKDGVEQNYGTFWVPTANRGIKAVHEFEWTSDGNSHTWDAQISRATGTAHAYMIAAGNVLTTFVARDIGPVHP